MTAGFVYHYTECLVQFGMCAHAHVCAHTQMPLNQNASMRACIICAIQKTGHGLYDFILAVQNFE